MPNIDPKLFTVNFHQEDFAEQALTKLREWGVLVIEEVFSPEEMKATMDALVDHLVKLSHGFDPKRPKKTWIKENLPPMVRDGLFQAVMGNLPEVTHIRSDPRVRKVFQTIYSALRGFVIDEFVSSLDGVNIRPPIPEYFDAEKSRDWAHIDQTHRKKLEKMVAGEMKYVDDGYHEECVQGQVVMTHTTAGFRCSPKSHLMYDHFLDHYGGGERSNNWALFNSSDYEEMADKLEEKGGAWQQTVHANPGSMILWFSSTVHSAQTQSAPGTMDLPESPWKDWRGVIYTCLRPAREVFEKHKRQLQCAFFQNRMTNHWGEKVFPTRPVTQRRTVYHPKIQGYIKDPTSAWRDLGLDEKDESWVSKDWQRLLGIPLEKSKDEESPEADSGGGAGSEPSQLDELRA